MAAKRAIQISGQQNEPVYFNGLKGYPTKELERRALCFGVFISLVYKHDLDKVRKLNRKLGIKDSGVLLEGNIAEHKWEDLIKFTARIIYDDLIEKVGDNG